jgi:hypothetical protein
MEHFELRHRTAKIKYNGEETKYKSFAANYTAKKQNIILGRKSTWNSTSTTRTWHML